MTKKRYILFGIIDYYPSGGMNDSMFSFNTKEEMLEGVKGDILSTQYQVFDTETFRVGEGYSPTLAFENL